MSSREIILNRVKNAVGPMDVDRQAEHRAIARDYRAEPTLDREAVIELFAERLRDYDALVHACDESAIAATIADVLAARKKTSLLVAMETPEAWLPAGFQFIRDEGLSYVAMDASEGVLTGCAVAIALTGTICVRHSPSSGRRALTLVPDYHLCIVYVDQVVETVPEGMRRMTALLPAPLTTISGPSATSDIEMTRIKGVHGPRTLEVILVTPSPK